MYGGGDARTSLSVAQRHLFEGDIQTNERVKIKNEAVLIRIGLHKWSKGMR